MLVKWIVCKTDEQRRDAFSRAQEAWAWLAETEGFLGQIGGWERRDPFVACIVSFWKDRDHYHRFMAETHDRIMAQNSQDQTYRSIQVALSSRLPNESGDFSLSLALRRAGLVRMDSMTVDPSRESDVLHNAKTVRFPGSRDSGALLGHMWTQDLDRSRQFRILTFWRDEEAHHHESQSEIPAFVTQPESMGIEHPGISRLFRPEPRWIVIPD